MVLWVPEGADSKPTRATPAPSAGPDNVAAAAATANMGSMPWRPRSAPKASHSRSTSPFLFWSRRGLSQHSQNSQHSQQSHQEHWSGTTRTTSNGGGYCGMDGDKHESYDGTCLDSVSNHLGKMTPPARSGQGTPSGWIDSVDSGGEWERDVGGGEDHATPPPVITRREYESLPLAIQRKYFSAVERLQFEQDSNEVDRIYDHYDLQAHHPPSKPRGHRAALSSPETLTLGLRTRNQHYDSPSPSATSWEPAEELPQANLSEKLQNRAALTREEQVNLIRQLRASVILDAANEAISKVARGSNRECRSLSPTPDIDNSTPTLSSRRGSLDSMTSPMAQQEVGGRDAVRESLYDSFRWLDEEEDLDLGLFLDDYHANLREDIPQTNWAKNRRPSFRRRISVSKLPFGRSSMTSNRAEAKETTPAPSPGLAMPASSHPQRRLSKRVSVLNPGKHAHQESTTRIIDPAATHYQDPEARQKLRAYLASPSKFDEAVQFGFPTTDSQQDAPAAGRRVQLRIKPSAGHTQHMRSFMDFGGDEGEADGEDGDADLSDRDDASSMSDPDSPKTPQMGGLTPPPGHQRPRRASTDPLGQGSSMSRHSSSMVPIKPMSSDSAYVPTLSSSREMTMRMTLTRPDLRANEELIYGWQPQASYVRPAPARKPQSSSSTKTFNNDHIETEDISETHLPMGTTTTACWSEGSANKQSIENVLAGFDQCGPDGGPGAGDQNVMKRFWNKVRRA